jgi:hypothetical protein
MTFEAKLTGNTIKLETKQNVYNVELVLPFRDVRKRKNDSTRRGISPASSLTTNNLLFDLVSRELPGQLCRLICP